jgi:predicted enzyme related to lactoylglutathione lyase
MSAEMPDVPAGTGKHPIPMVVITANDLSSSTAFYGRVFGWQTLPVSKEVTAVVGPAGPTVSLRSDVPDGFPGVVPFIGVPDVDDTLQRVVASGGAVERATWSMPMVGKLARFKDPSGTIYGLTDAVPAAAMPRLPAPFGSRPKPPAGTLCALEMYAADGAAAARLFSELFGWGTRETMPQYVAFDPGAGVTGTFQSHTPALPAVAYIYVTDAFGKVEEIEAAGGARIGDPMSVEGIATFGYFKDPSGTTMGLIAP